MDDTLVFPRDLLRILYWVFFRPITLERYIKSFDAKLARDTSLFTLWIRGNNYPELRQLVWLCFFHILITPWITGFVTAGVFGLFGYSVNWFILLIGIVFGVVVGVAVGVLGGGALGVGLGAGLGIAVGVTVGVAVGEAREVVVGIGDGVAIGAAVGVVLGVAVGVARGVEVGVVLGVMFGIAVGVVFDILFGPKIGVAGGAAVGLSFILSYLRLYFYPFYVPLSLFLARRARRGGGAHLFHFSPVSWDELIWFPLLGLDRLLIEIGKQNRLDEQQPLALVAQSFRQKWAAQNALVELTAYDIERAIDLQQIRSIADQFAWLPHTMAQELENVLPPIREVSQSAKAAVDSDTLYNKQQLLRSALEQTRKVRTGFGLTQNRLLATRFGHSLEVWEGVFERELAGLSKEEIIPNVYVSGSPLATDSKVFKGRRDIFVALERELSSPAEQRPAILLFGARRTGKTSAIKQMPVRLGPNVIPVEINLQAATVAQDASGILYYIAEQIRNNASLYRRVQLEPLTRETLRDDPYLTFLDWLSRVERVFAPRWILLNLDEYESLTEMMEQGRLDERIFQLLRDVIQHRSQVSVLLSGSHTLQDLPPIWSHYLINVRTLHIGSLAESEARELVINPIPDFPLQYEPSTVERILTATGCQPFLVQATCRDLVDLLNHEKRMMATVADVEKTLAGVLTTGGAYFADLWGGRDSDEGQRKVMRELATARNLRGLGDLEGLSKTLNTLVHRDILEHVDGEYRFRVELVRRWIVENGE